MFLGVIDQRRPRRQLPFPPRCDDIHIRIKRIITQLKSDLIIALAGGPVGNRVSSGLGSNFDLAFGDQRPSARCAQQVGAFINGACAKNWKNIVADEFFAEVFDIDFLDAQHFGFRPCRLNFFALAKIGGKGDDLTAIIFLQPFQNDGCIQSTRIGQHHFIDVLSHLHRPVNSSRFPPARI